MDNARKLTRLPFITFVFVALSLSYLAGYSFIDDGWRHIAFAANKSEMHSWGQVYPHSLFFNDYDPWWGWHSLLSLLLLAIPYQSMVIALNFLTVLSLSWVLYAFLRKHNGAKWLYLNSILTIAIVGFSFRYLNGRPDNLSGIYILFALLFANRPRLLLASTLAYATLYYLFFVHTLLLAFVFILARKHQGLIMLLLGCSLGFMIHSLVGGAHYWQTILYTVTDSTLRDGLMVNELKPSIPGLSQDLFFPALFLISLANLFYFRVRCKTLPALHWVFFFASMPLWLFFSRYMALYQVILISSVLVSVFSILRSKLSTNEQKLFEELPINCMLFFLVIAPLFTQYHFIFSPKQNILDRSHFILDAKYNNATFLSNELNEINYSTLFLNPTIHFIPSCSIGWFKKENELQWMKYKQLMATGQLPVLELLKLSQFTGADYYLHFYEGGSTKLEKYFRTNSYKITEKQDDFFVVKLQ